jgi:hypothetical protein
MNPTLYVAALISLLSASRTFPDHITTPDLESLLIEELDRIRSGGMPHAPEALAAENP